MKQVIDPVAQATDYLERKKAALAAAAGASGFSSPQEMIATGFQLLANEYSFREIAEMFQVSVSTVHRFTGILGVDCPRDGGAQPGKTYNPNWNDPEYRSRLGFQGAAAKAIAAKSRKARLDLALSYLKDTSAFVIADCMTQMGHTTKEANIRAWRRGDATPREEDLRALEFFVEKVKNIWSKE